MKRFAMALLGFALSLVTLASGPTITLNPAVAAGQAEVVTVFMGTSSNSVSSVTQTNCTWAQATFMNGSGRVEIWYCLSAGSSPGSTISIVLSSLDPNGYGAFEKTYAYSLTALDKTATYYSSTAATTTQTGTTATTTQASELCVAGIAILDASKVGYSVTALSNSYVSRSGADYVGTGEVWGTYADFTQTTAAAQSSTATLSASTTAPGCIATFKIGASVGGNHSLSVMGVG